MSFAAFDDLTLQSLAYVLTQLVTNYFWALSLFFGLIALGGFILLFTHSPSSSPQRSG